VANPHAIQLGHCPEKLKTKDLEIVVGQRSPSNAHVEVLWQEFHDNVHGLNPVQPWRLEGIEQGYHAWMSYRSKQDHLADLTSLVGVHTLDCNLTALSIFRQMHRPKATVANLRQGAVPAYRSCRNRRT
jgi:hypothetical protein